MGKEEALAPAPSPVISAEVPDRWGAGCLGAAPRLSTRVWGLLAWLRGWRPGIPSVGHSLGREPGVLKGPWGIIY